MRYKLTDKQMKQVLDSLVVLVDTRENSNQHIIDFFESKKIPYKRMKLDYGDYSIMLPKLEGVTTQDIYFTNDFVIERKANIDELCGNLKEDAARLKKELAHLNMYQIKYWIYIEDLNFEENLRQGNYISQYDPYTLMQRLYKGIEAEYNTAIIPVSKKCIGSKIYYHLQACVYNLFKHKGFFEEESEGNDENN